MKKIILLVLSFMCMGMIGVNGQSKDVYFIFDSPKQVELKNGKAEEIAEKLKLEDENGDTYDAVVNVIGGKKIAISPIEKIDEKLKIKDISDYKISDYEGNIYVQNESNLKKISKYLQRNRGPVMPLYSVKEGAVEDVVGRDEAVATESSNQSAKTSENKSNDYSKTNVQTQGVDEADIVKTDGKNIYCINDGDLLIVDANTKNMQVKSKIETKKRKTLNNIYIDNNKLSLIYAYNEYKDDNYKNVTLVDTYDVSNASKPKLLNSKSAKGFIYESRKKGDIIYTVTSDYFNTKYKETPNIFYRKDFYARPSYEFDSTGIDLTKMIYMPFNPSEEITYITAMQTTMSKNNNELLYMGSSGDIYMSTDNIYISTPIYDYNYKTYEFIEGTGIKKIAVDKMNFNYSGYCEFEGNILNQFSLNENNGNLFVAYTKYQYDDKSENVVASYDKNMKKLSELDGLAKGERIYSVRFIKDKAYLVTFKQVDPLFVIDLKNPKNLKVLGYLKIPGYSEYLHPYKDNYLIGFGQNTANKGERVVNDGFKMSLFDISDFNNPKEVDTESIGAKGTYSSIENDHKALMFDERRNIFAIPMYVTRLEKRLDSSPIVPTFSGVYVYDISEKGFDIKGRITHYTEKQQDSAKYDVYEYERQIQRSVQIRDNLYTVSEYGIKVNDINTLKEIATLEFE
ncbi:MAG: beta-propeller domain-containing protein [Peptoanaerobacter stomatis]|uniref:beta-propeller domain-containing protein n=1 Tax=Peptoanaerobacter stomatis TaxID=796937 RepID=UPI003FA0A362